MQDARIARLAAARTAVVVGILALGACGSSDPEAPPPPCPTALLLDGAERTSAYRADAEPRPADLRYLALLTDLSSTCRYYDDPNGQGVDVDLSFKLIAERGPALSGSEEVTSPVPGPRSGSVCLKISLFACRRSPRPGQRTTRCTSAFSWTTQN